jgi:RNA polymerase sigma-54 factor
MYLEQWPATTAEQRLRISTDLITGLKILGYSAEELEQCIAQEIERNPALEIDVQARCLHCGAQTQSDICPICERPSEELASPQLQNLDSEEESGDQWYDRALDEERTYDPLEFARSVYSLEEYLLHQLAVLLPSEYHATAEYLVGNLNAQGYLTVSVSETAQVLAVSQEQVRAVLQALQSLDPPGIGARDLRECLLIQRDSFDHHSMHLAIARRLVKDFLAQLGAHQFAEIAEQLEISSLEVTAVWHFIQSQLNPYPAHAFVSNNVPECGPGGVCDRSNSVRPDVVIRRVEQGFEAEVIDRRRYHLYLNATYSSLRQECTRRSEAKSILSDQERQHVREYATRARFFMHCVAQRWNTLQIITENLIAQQYAFLEHGARYLRPLTQKDVALAMGIHESTVSRATANKYILLPTGRTAPFRDFFDGSLAAKEVLRGTIDTEDVAKPISDREVARRLAEQGISLVRRTIVKYRGSLGIASSRLRAEQPS